MHPILGHLRRLVLYLLAWVPVALLLAYLMSSTAGLSRREAAALAFPLCFLDAFFCLSAWSTCRATPFDRSTIGKLAATHLTAAAATSALLILIAYVLAYGYPEAGYFAGLAERLPRALPLLFGAGVLFYLLSANFYYVLIAVQTSQEAEARVMQASVLAREAELRALKAQVNPHFLFNSLNSISALTASDPAKAREMCVLLGDFLRQTLGLSEKGTISLGEELALIRAFLAVEKIRFGARVALEEAVEKDALDAQVPPLLLQPLVENAVGHGIANLVEGGWIRLDAHCRNGKLAIAIENTYDPEAPPRRRNGMGLANVRQRLAARYGDAARMDVKKEGDRFRVALALPAEPEAGSS